MQPELFTRENIHSLPFPQSEDGDYARRYLIPLMTDGPQKYIRNVYNTQMMAVKIDDAIIPITVTDFTLRIPTRFHRIVIMFPTAHSKK